MGPPSTPLFTGKQPFYNQTNIIKRSETTLKKASKEKSSKKLSVKKGCKENQAIDNLDHLQNEKKITRNVRVSRTKVNLLSSPVQSSVRRVSFCQPNTNTEQQKSESADLSVVCKVDENKTALRQNKKPLHSFDSTVEIQNHIQVITRNRKKNTSLLNDSQSPISFLSKDLLVNSNVTLKTLKVILHRITLPYITSNFHNGSGISVENERTKGKVLRVILERANIPGIHFVKAAKKTVMPKLYTQTIPDLSKECCEESLHSNDKTSKSEKVCPTAISVLSTKNVPCSESNHSVDKKKDPYNECCSKLLVVLENISPAEPCTTCSIPRKRSRLQNRVKTNKKNESHLKLLEKIYVPCSESNHSVDKKKDPYNECNKLSVVLENISPAKKIGDAEQYTTCSIPRKRDRQQNVVKTTEKNKTHSILLEKEKIIVKNVRDKEAKSNILKELPAEVSTKNMSESDVSISFKNPSRNLRKHIKKNYCEETLTYTPNAIPANLSTKTFERKGPVYKQIATDEDNSEKGDLYEFNDFSPAEKKSQKLRKGKKLSMFDKTTHNILQKIQDQEKKAKKKTKRKIRKYKDGYNVTVSEIVKKVMDKVDKQKNVPVTVNLQHPGRKEGKENVSENVLSPVPSTISTDKQTNIHSANEIQNEMCDTIYDKNQRNYSNSDLFGFDMPSPDSSPNSSPIKSMPRVSILSDITLNKSILASPSQFDQRRPNANSTFVHIQPFATTSKVEPTANKALMDKKTMKETPWRFKLDNIKRNPHFLILKDSGLPCKHQEMVITYSDIKNIEKRCSKTPRRLEQTGNKSPVQRSILDYVEGSVQTKENIPSQHSSLFDYDDFNSPDKSGIYKVVVATKVQTVKRNVLAQIEENIIVLDDGGVNLINKSTEVQIDYFGFEESFENGEQNRSVCAEQGRPDVSFLKKYPSRKAEKHVKFVEPVKKLKYKSTAAEEVEFEPLETLEDNQSEVNGNQMKLFDDPEEILECMSPELKEKRGRRKRLFSFSSDVSDNEKPKKKRKNAKVAAEEAAFEKWASEFNSMCEEVDQHELEIE